MWLHRSTVRALCLRRNGRYGTGNLLSIWTDALPVGNGRLGAMVFGGIETDRLQLNEDTLWSGSPRDWDNAGAKAFLPEIRRLVIEQAQYKEADAVCKNMQGPYTESYQPLGNLNLKFETPEAATHYKRELDLDTAIASVNYSASGTAFTRNVFSSAPDQVIVVHLTADKPGKLSLRAPLDSPLQFSVSAPINIRYAFPEKRLPTPILTT